MCSEVLSGSFKLSKVKEDCQGNWNVSVVQPLVFELQGPSSLHYDTLQ